MWMSHVQHTLNNDHRRGWNWDGERRDWGGVGGGGTGARGEGRGLGVGEVEGSSPEGGFGTEAGCNEGYKCYECVTPWNTGM